MPCGYRRFYGILVLTCQPWHYVIGDNMQPNTHFMTMSTEDAPKGSLARGPRNLPKPDRRKVRRQLAKASRKANRGIYSGQ